MKKTLIYTSLAVLLALGLMSAKAFLSSTKNTKTQNLPPKAEEINITLIEGWDIDDIANNLESKGLAQANVFKKTANSFDVSQYPLLEDHPATATLEGYIFPDTYRLFKPKSLFEPALSQELLKKALDNFHSKFTPAMIAQAQTDKMSIYQIVTLASIIEKETGRNAITPEQKSALDQERKIVASVFYNRLKTGMPLESDATINYITHKNNPSPSQQDLAVVSPYNTYQNKGLPPGPICNPSLSSLLAALYPANTDYYFFLHKQPSGEPIFSKTFEEHVNNKLKYLK